MRKYLGVLNLDGLKVFLSDFYSFYVGAGVNVNVSPNVKESNFTVLLEPNNLFFQGELEEFLHNKIFKHHDRIAELGLKEVEIHLLVEEIK